MADPFSLAAGAIGTIGLALQTITALFNEIQAIQNAPALITSLGRDLEAVQAVLQQFNSPTNLTTLQTLRPETQSALWLAVQQCTQVCHSFRVKVQKWTSRSTDGKMHWWVRARVGLFEVAEIEFLRDALAASNDTMNAALALATLLSAVQTAETTKETKDNLAARQTELTQMLEALDERTTSINLQLASLTPETRAPVDSYTCFISQDRNPSSTGTHHAAHNVPEGPHLATEILDVFHHSKQLLKQLISDPCATRNKDGKDRHGERWQAIGGYDQSSGEAGDLARYKGRVRPSGKGVGL